MFRLTLQQPFQVMFYHASSAVFFRIFPAGRCGSPDRSKANRERRWRGTNFCRRTLLEEFTVSMSASGFFTEWRAGRRAPQLNGSHPCEMMIIHSSEHITWKWKTNCFDRANYKYQLSLPKGQTALPCDVCCSFRHRSDRLTAPMIRSASEVNTWTSGFEEQQTCLGSKTGVTQVLGYITV